MSSHVFSSAMRSADIFADGDLTKQQEDQLIATLFEQLLIFEKVTIRTNRTNQSLFTLIKRLGLTTVERLVRSGYIEFMLWTPVLVTGTGFQKEDGTMDESVIYGQPPIVSGSLSDEDLDPENNIAKALNRFDLTDKTKRSLTKSIGKLYQPIDGMDFAKDSAELVIDAYKNNNLSELGLPFEKDPDQLDLPQRGKLLELGHQVIETAVLANFGYKSYENYEHLKICEKNLENIGKGYNVAGNTSHLFSLEQLPDLKAVHHVFRYDFDAVFKIRHLEGAKYYRKWINEIGDHADAGYITKEYLNEIRGKYKYFETPQGKFFKNASMFTVGTVLSNLFKSPEAGVTGGYLFGLLEEYVVDGLFKGHNPSMFITELKDEIDDKS